jgi:hypothetical protein
VPATLAVFHPDGRIVQSPLRAAEPVRFDSQVTFTLHDLIVNAQTREEPVIEPLEFRRPNVDRQISAIRLRFTGRGPLEGWSDSRWCVFSMYPHIDWRPHFRVNRLTIQPPGSPDSWDLVFSRVPHELNTALAARKLSVEFFPGRDSVSTWRSDFAYQAPDGSSQAAAVFTNNTYNVGSWTLFQSGADSDHWAYTILGVGNRYGIWPMVLGCVLITIGSLYAFYVKPVLRRRAKERAIAEARARGRLPAEAEYPAEGAVRIEEEEVGVTR